MTPDREQLSKIARKHGHGLGSLPPPKSAPLRIWRQDDVIAAMQEAAALAVAQTIERCKSACNAAYWAPVPPRSILGMEPTEFGDGYREACLYLLNAIRALPHEPVEKPQEKPATEKKLTAWIPSLGRAVEWIELGSGTWPVESQDRQDAERWRFARLGNWRQLVSWNGIERCYEALRPQDADKQVDAARALPREGKEE